MEINRDYPKILILNQPFVDNTGGGITLTNLFDGWPKERLAVACSGYLLDPNHLNTHTCDTYYQLGHKERKWRFPFSLMGRKYPSGPVTFQNLEKVIVKESDKSSKRKSFLSHFVEPVLKATGLAYMASRTRLSLEFKSFLVGFSPQLLYVQCSSLESILFSMEVADYLKIPVVFHMMDDWPSIISKNTVFGGYWYKRIDKLLKRLLQRSDLQLSISDLMSQEYERRYGGKWQAFHNPIDFSFWRKGHAHTLVDKKVRKELLYAGRIGLGIDDSLKNIAAAIERVNMEANLKVDFVIQSQHPPDWVDQFQSTQHRQQIPYNELPNQFAAADFLILPYDFNQKALDYIKYSMPTKASEYMASGTPTIIYAPGETALAKYALKEEWGLVIDSHDVGHLCTKLEGFFLSVPLQKKYVERAVYLAESRHEKSKVVARFQHLIKETAS